MFRKIRGNNLYGIRPNSESLVTIRLDRQGLYMDTRNILVLDNSSHKGLESSLVMKDRGLLICSIVISS